MISKKLKVINTKIIYNNRKILMFNIKRNNKIIYKKMKIINNSNYIYYIKNKIKKIN